MNLVFFDFCETLVNFQTADAFVDFCMKKTRKGKCYTIVQKSKLGSDFLGKHWKLNKKIHLYQLRNLTKEEIERFAEEFYNECILPCEYHPIVRLLDEHKSNGDCVYIVSGGYVPYIECFSKKHKIDGVIANDFMYVKGKFTGKICEKDCMGEEKVIRTAELLNRNDYEKSFFYSDSYSDLPLFKKVDRKILVSREKHRRLADEYGLEQIVINEMEGYEYK